MADKMPFRVVFIENPVNGGIAQGNNLGMIEALHDKCDYILFSNNDIVIDKNAITILLDSLISLNVDMVVPKIYFHNSSLIWYAGGRFDCLRGVLHISIIRKKILINIIRGNAMNMLLLVSC